MEFLLLSRRRSFARNVSSGEERGETVVFAGYVSARISVVPSSGTVEIHASCVWKKPKKKNSNKGLTMFITISRWLTVTSWSQPTEKRLLASSLVQWFSVCFFIAWVAGTGFLKAKGEISKAGTWGKKRRWGLPSSLHVPLVRCVLYK